jgi:hypothetical protein
VFGRDPALRAIAERRQWRQLVMLGGTLRAPEQLDTTVEEMLVDFDSAPTPLRPDDDIPNVVPFPLSARTAGVA